MFIVKKITTEETYFIREEVLRKGIDLPFKFEGDFETETFHLGVFNAKGDIATIGTFMRNNCKLLQGEHYQLRGMATLPNFTKKGLGRLLLTDVVKELKQYNVEYLWCNARKAAVEFYKKNGFEIIGEAFLVEHIGIHYTMFRAIQ